MPEEQAHAAVSARKAVLLLPIAKGGGEGKGTQVMGGQERPGQVRSQGQACKADE